MSEANWKDAYEEILRQDSTQENGGQNPGGENRRKKPRFRIKSGYVWIKIQPRFTVVDVSVSGIALFSDYPFEVGEELSITLGKALNIISVVKECELVQSDEGLLENKYHVRCNFENEEQGMEFLVMIKETDELELEIAGVMPIQAEKDELELEIGEEEPDSREEVQAPKEKNPGSREKDRVDPDHEEALELPE